MNMLDTMLANVGMPPASHNAMTTCSYTDMMKCFANKAKHYTPAQCKQAIADIDATLDIQMNMREGWANTVYIIKLNCERDAMLDKLYLSPRKQNEDNLHH